MTRQILGLDWNSEIGDRRVRISGNTLDSNMTVPWTESQICTQFPLLSRLPLDRLPVNRSLSVSVAEFRAVSRQPFLYRVMEELPAIRQEQSTYSPRLMICLFPLRRHRWSRLVRGSLV